MSWSRALLKRIEIAQKDLCEVGQEAGTDVTGTDTLIHANELLAALSGMVSREIELQEVQHKAAARSYTEALREFVTEDS
jgi:hypothetical protein